MKPNKARTRRRLKRNGARYSESQLELVVVATSALDEGVTCGRGCLFGLDTMDSMVRRGFLEFRDESSSTGTNGTCYSTPSGVELAQWYCSTHRPRRGLDRVARWIVGRRERSRGFYGPATGRRRL